MTIVTDYRSRHESWGQEGRGVIITFRRLLTNLPSPPAAARQISKADFPLVLEYAVSVRGAARARLGDEMRAVVEARDRWPSLRAEGQTREQVRETIGRDKPSKRAYRRARSLLQSLDDEE